MIFFPAICGVLELYLACWVIYRNHLGFVTWVDPNNPAAAIFGAIAKDPKLIGAAIALLIYFAYLVLRDSIQDTGQKSKH